ncbi:MAG: type IV pilus assembly protein PilM [bacterium]
MFDLKSIFGMFIKPEEKSVLGVDIGSSSIKLVQLKKQKGQAILETYGEIALGPYGGQEVGHSTSLTLDKIVSALTDLVRESNATTKFSALSLPISSSLISFITVPNLDDKKLAEIIPLEARKYIPVAPSEVSLDYWVMPKESDGLSEFQTEGEKNNAQGTKEVLLVVVHNDASNKNVEIAKSSNLELGFSEIEIFASMRSILPVSMSPQMIMDFGAGSTKIYIIERGVLRASHTINRGGQDISFVISKSLGIPFDAAEALKKETGLLPSEKGTSEAGMVTMDFIFSEARRVIFNYQRKSNKNISKIYLSGGGSNLKGFVEAAEAAFQMPVEISNPFNKVQYPAFLEDILRSVGPEFAVAIGLALRKLEENN